MAKKSDFEKVFGSISKYEIGVKEPKKKKSKKKKQKSNMVVLISKKPKKKKSKKKKQKNVGIEDVIRSAMKKIK